MGVSNLNVKLKDDANKNALSTGIEEKSKLSDGKQTIDNATNALETNEKDDISENFQKEIKYEEI